MTLKDKFINILHNWIDKDYDREHVSVLLEIDADDYAIEFAEWLNINYFQIVGTKTWCKTLSMKYKYTSKELLEIFKKEKGL